MITTLDFGSVEQIWLQFWSQTGRDETIPIALFHSICSLNTVQDFIKNADYQLYQQLVERLIADILSPMPSTCPLLSAEPPIRSSALLSLSSECNSIDSNLRQERRRLASCRARPPARTLEDHQADGHQCICHDAAPLHLVEPLGAGGTRRASQHHASQPDVSRPEQS